MKPERRRWYAFAGALILAFAGAYLSWRAQLRSSQTELLSLHPVAEIEANLGASSRRGRAPTHLGKRDSFRLGAWTFELRAAAERGEASVVASKAREIEVLVGSIPAPELRILIGEIERHPFSRQRAKSQCEELDRLFRQADWLIDTSQYELGRFTLAASRALESKRPDLVSSLGRDTVGRVRVDQEAVLEGIARLIAKGQSERAQAELRELLAQGGLVEAD